VLDADFESQLSNRHKRHRNLQMQCKPVLEGGRDLFVP
jgi:hypothetical protein